MKIRHYFAIVAQQKIKKIMKQAWTKMMTIGTDSTKVCHLFSITGVLKRVSED